MTLSKLRTSCVKCGNPADLCLECLVDIRCVLPTEKTGHGAIILTGTERECEAKAGSFLARAATLRTTYKSSHAGQAVKSKTRQPRTSGRVILEAIAPERSASFCLFLFSRRQRRLNEKEGLPYAPKHFKSQRSQTPLTLGQELRLPRQRSPPKQLR